VNFAKLDYFREKPELHGSVHFCGKTTNSVAWLQTA